MHERLLLRVQARAGPQHVMEKEVHSSVHLYSDFVCAGAGALSVCLDAT